MPLRRVLSPELLGMKPANLKDVFKMGCEVQRQRQLAWLNVIIVYGNYVVYGESFSVDYALQVHTKSLDRNGFSARKLQLLVCELEFGN